MRKIFVLFLVVLILPILYAESSLYNSEELLINVNISGGASIEPSAGYSNLKYVTLNLSFFPFNDKNQIVKSMTVNPPGEEAGKSVLFRWNEPSGEVSYSVDADVRTFNRRTEVLKKVKFPLDDLPEDVLVYTKSSETIDSENPEIIKTASELASGEDDLFVVLHKIAFWTKNNVEYDLSTLTESVSQKASWVLTNKQGVCDEITTLFIALARSLGIPARFVSGVAYTESELFPQKWGAHGWAEIYFPDYGWVPFDVTYGQFGFVDATHIKLKESLDPKEPSSNFEWLGTNVKLNTRNLVLNADIKQTSGSVAHYVDVDADVLKKNIGFGSYNVIFAEVVNLKDYYVSVQIYASVPGEIVFLDEQMKEVLLKPKEMKKVFWKVKLTENLNRNYVYTFPVSLVTLENHSFETSFKSSANDIVYSLDVAERFVENSIVEDEKVYSKNVDFTCVIDKKEFYEDEKAEVVCFVKNTGNVFLKDLTLCLKKDCMGFDLGISQEYNKSFVVEEKQGSYDLPAHVENNDILKSSYVRFVVHDKPRTEIENLSFPNDVRFDEEFSVSFLLKKISVSEPKSVNVKLVYGSESKEWTFSHIAEDRGIEVAFRPKILLKDKNDLKILVSYEDNKGNKFFAEKDFWISLHDVNFFQRVEMFFRSIGVFIGSFFG